MYCRIYACVLTAMALGLCSLQRARGDATTQPADPAEWNIASKSPPFREMIKGDTWDIQFGKALDELGGIDGLMKSDKLPSFCWVYSVLPDTQAQTIGLSAGDLITQIDGKPIGLKELTDLRQNRDQTLTFIDQSKITHTATIHPGLVGVTQEWEFNPEIFYLRQGTRNASWDDYAIAGIGERMSNPDLAETAWFHAINAGYTPDFLSTYAAMQIAWRQGRNDDALAYGMALQNTGGPSTFLKNAAFFLGVANFKLEQALAMRLGPTPGARQLRGETGDFLQFLLDRYRKVPADQRRLPSPREMAQDNSVDLLPEMVPYNSGDQGHDTYVHDIINWLAGKRVLEWHIPAGQYYDVVAEPKDAAPEVQLTVHLDLKPSDNVATEFDRVVILSLVNCDDPRYLADAMAPALGGMVSLEIYPTGACNIIEGSNTHTTVARIPIYNSVANDRNFTVQFFHAAGRDEIWIDNVRALYLPSPENAKKVGFRLGAVGLDTHLKVDFSQINQP